MEKQDLQAAESWGQNSSSTTPEVNSKRKPIAIWIEKDGFKPGSRLDWKILETI